MGQVTYECAMDVIPQLVFRGHLSNWCKYFVTERAPLVYIRVEAIMCWKLKHITIVAYRDTRCVLCCTVCPMRTRRISPHREVAKEHL